MRIVAVRATTVTVPLEAPLRHANGVHGWRFVRTIVELETDNGLVGWGELGGGGESAERAMTGLKAYLCGHDPFQLEALRFRICNPTASLYNNRTQVHAAIEFACLDLIGKHLGASVSDLLGGWVRDAVPFASYLFFRYPAADGTGEVRSIPQLVAHARGLRERCGFRAHKLKGGVFPSEYELGCYRALAAAFPKDTFRYDPNAALSVEEGLWFVRGIADLRNDYLEDPTWGMAGMRRLRGLASMPLATNTVVVNFEQLAANIHDLALDVILLDTTFWGGIRACVKAAAVCETFQLGIAVHSSGELGIQLATMLHLGAVLPNLTFAADAHYHQLTDDILVGGPLRYQNGAIAVPTGPGLGVEVDPERLRRYNALYRELGNYPYDRNPGRPDWYPLVPNTKWADLEEAGFPVPWANALKGA